MIDRKKFKHTIQIRVRNYEVDWQGIVHNGNYLLYFEAARIEYLKHLGVKVDMKSIQGEGKVVLVRNEIDYESPAYFDELLEVSTRMSFIRDSSFAMEGIIEKNGGEILVARNVAYHVWLDPRTDRPKTIGDDFRKLVQAFESTDCEISWTSMNVW
ncbi:MAG: acyl-CoA thioesterase [Ignavibacteria bacterium]|nr:acyl-CoA thioesterase [Ignavibacteria bacterium]